MPSRGRRTRTMRISFVVVKNRYLQMRGPDLSQAVLVELEVLMVVFAFVGIDGRICFRGVCLIFCDVVVMRMVVVSCVFSL